MPNQPNNPKKKKTRKPIMSVIFDFGTKGETKPSFLPSFYTGSVSLFPVSISCRRRFFSHHTLDLSAAMAFARNVSASESSILFCVHQDKKKLQSHILFSLTLLGTLSPTPKKKRTKEKKATAPQFSKSFIAHEADFMDVRISYNNHLDSCLAWRV